MDNGKDSSRLKFPVNRHFTSHCTLTIRSENYFVMWKHQEIKNTTSPEHNDGEQLDSTPIHQNSNVKNTLPFKVMGVAYSKEAQDRLEGAYDHLYIAKKNCLRQAVSRARKGKLVVSANSICTASPKLSIFGIGPPI